MTLLAVLVSYWENHTDKRPNPSAARRHGNLLLDFLGSTAKVSEFTKTKQIEFIKHLHEQGLTVAYIARLMTTIGAALRRVTAKEDEEDESAMLVRAPRIIAQAVAIAQMLDAPEPTPRNWHPDMAQIAAALDAIPPEEESRLMRFIILMLAFAARNEAIQQIAPFQIDTRYKLLALNPPGRRQNKKHRPTLPVPPAIWELVQSWCDGETLVSKDRERLVMKDGERVAVKSRNRVILRKPWRAMIKAAGLPKGFTPYALRHFMATEFRLRGVSEEQRERWMGHRKETVNDGYGKFAPSYLEEARDAVLVELSALCKTSSFRQVTVKPVPRLTRLRAVST